MNREALVSEVGTAMLAHLHDLEQYLGTTLGGVRTDVVRRARKLTDLLDDPRQAPEAARALMAGMFGHGPVSVEFWKSEAGRAVALAIGYHQETVPYVIAAVILGVSRQRVYQMCEEGVLRRVEGAHAVTPASLRDALSGTRR